MGKLQERVGERAEITAWHDLMRGAIHEEYMKMLSEIDSETSRRRRNLAKRQRDAWNKALEIVDAEEGNDV